MLTRCKLFCWLAKRLCITTSCNQFGRKNSGSKFRVFRLGYG
jgi:hypothetical protein